jgi:hypothetical protein
MNAPEEKHGDADGGMTPRNPVVAFAASTVVHALIAVALLAMGITAAHAIRREPAPVLVAEWVPPAPSGIAPAPPELPVPGGAPAYAGPAGRARTSSGNKTSGP